MKGLFRTLGSCNTFRHHLSVSDIKGLIKGLEKSFCEHMQNTADVEESREKHVQHNERLWKSPDSTHH